MGGARSVRRRKLWEVGQQGCLIRALIRARRAGLGEGLQVIQGAPPRIGVGGLIGNGDGPGERLWVVGWLTPPPIGVGGRIRDGAGWGEGLRPRGGGGPSGKGFRSLAGWPQPLLV